MRDKKCIICKENQLTEVLYKENFDFKKINNKTFSARRIPDGTHYRFLRCRNCGLIFSSPILEQKEISKLYSKSTFNYSNESEFLQKTYLKYFKEYVLDKDFKNKKILEIGCGNGFFLEELEKLGVKELYGVEPGKASVDKAKQSLKKNIRVAMFKKGLFSKESFDVICCFHTFDHIIDPDIFLAEVFSLLKKNGKAYFVVHNTNGLSVKLLRGRSPIFDIEHIYLYNPENLKQIFKMQGFRKTEVFSVKNIYQINYWLKLLPIPLFLKKFLFLFLKTTRIGEIPIAISAGNVGIVGVKPD
jgi:2-polyprenyl-3-methyl-5-hydroxy-6-metoxy-1,4-benzoquinol methylase